METFLRTMSKHKVGWARGALSLYVGLFLLVLFSTTLYAAEAVLLFGPETYTRTTGKPNVFERSFNLPSGIGAPFAIKVKNGNQDQDESNRISSASIVLNGIEVVKENDFNQQVAAIERVVSLGATNRLLVKFQSKPGSFISVEITGISVAPSVKKTIGPAGGTIELQGTINHVELNIPPGALPANTEITIRQVPTPAPDQFFGEGIVPIGNTFSFEPHGLTLSVVVAITFSYRDDEIPTGENEGGVEVWVDDAPDGLFHTDAGALCGIEEPAGPHCIDNTESIAQGVDIDKNLVSVFVNEFSHRLLAIRGVITGCNGDLKAHPTQLTLEAEGFDLPILRCLRPNVGARPDQAQISKIVLHSTANTHATRQFRDEIATCAIDLTRCPDGFAHYYIDRDGVIVQVATDDSQASHICAPFKNGGPNPKCPTRHLHRPEIVNSNSLGIELFNNVGEPYDGRQMTALIQLVDMLVRMHPAITRPTLPQDPETTSLIVHEALDPDRRLDPVGTFRTSNEIWFVDRPLENFKTKPLPGGSPLASTLFDAVVAGVSAMGRDFTGLINTSGGDSLGLAQAGNGGNINYTGGSLVETPLSVGTNHTGGYTIFS